MAKSTLKFRDSVAEVARIGSSVEARNFSPIYLLMGEESYFIDQLCDRLDASILSEAERSFNSVTLYGKDSEVGQVINCCRQMPMMGERQVVILKEAQQLRTIEKLSLYTSKPNPSTILIICHKDKSLDKRSQLYKHCAAQGVVFESIRPRDYEIAPWLSEYIASRGCQIDHKALSMITENLGTDLSKITGEITKLLLSLPVGTTKITDSDVEQNIGISKEFNNFELCRAVSTRNFARALMIADHFARNPKDNPLLLTVMALFNEFKHLFVYNYLMWLTKFRNAAPPTDSDLMSKLNIRNSYAIGELRRTAPLWPNKRVFAILGLLREYDAKSKGINTGGASDGELLRELLLKIFTHP
ncbi:MAG: DNA polymerase III subunit delta [Rikenellaceae bacterium]